MSKKLCLSALVVALVVPVFAACGDDDGPTLMDGGRTDSTLPPTPPGTPPTPPGTPPTPPGTPPTPPTPPGTPPTPPPADGGLRDTGTPTPPTPPPPAGGACPPSVRTCLMSCMDDPCANACINADDACSECVFGSILDCAASMGCDDELGALDTCIMTNMCMTDACVTMNCMAQITAVQMCIPAACSEPALMECGVI